MKLDIRVGDRIGFFNREAVRGCPGKQPPYTETIVEEVLPNGFYCTDRQTQGVVVLRQDVLPPF